MNSEGIFGTAISFITLYGIKIIIALAILYIGKWAAKFCDDLVRKLMEKKGVDEAVRNFAGTLAYALIFAFVIIAALGQIGIQTASIIAVLGAAGLAVGLALQGSLANFAAGILMIMFKPCRIGDYVDAGGCSGTVEDISLLATTLLTPDNKRIIVPNGSIMSGAITNYSAMPTRRVDLVVGISYDADIKQAKAILQDIVDNESRILSDPAPTIAVAELADSSVNLVVRPWVNKEDYWGVFFDVTEKVKESLDSANIGIPYPQMDVHLHKQQ